MDTNIALQQRQIISEIKYLPAVSIIMPFRPVVTRKNELEYSLRSIMGKIEQELVTHYPTEKAVPVIIKLKSLIRHLNFNAHTKSIAIFVSSVAEKVYYMELEVQEQVVFSDSYNLSADRMRVAEVCVELPCLHRAAAVAGGTFHRLRPKRDVSHARRRIALG